MLLAASIVVDKGCWAPDVMCQNENKDLRRSDVRVAACQLGSAALFGVQRHARH